MSRTTLFRSLAPLVCCVLLWPAGRANAQGVTTGALAGVVKDAQGGVIPGATVLAVHQPSGSTYEAVTQSDGRFVMPGMRVGGPYTVTVTLPGFTSEQKSTLFHPVLTVSSCTPRSFRSDLPPDLSNCIVRKRQQTKFGSMPCGHLREIPISAGFFMRGTQP